MKILLLTNNIKDLDTLSKGVKIAKEKALTIGLTLDFTLRDTERKFTPISLTGSEYKELFVIEPSQIFQEAKTFNIPFDIPCLVFDETKYNPIPNHPLQYGANMQIPLAWYTTYPEVFAEFFLHELTHYFFYGTNKPDTTHAYLPQFNNRIDYYLFLIKGLMPVSKYKYFKDSEVVGLKPELVQLLDKAREIAGVPFKITSGYRDAEHNALVGGVEDSSHTTGRAVDLLVKNGIDGEKINSALHQVGIKRFGYYQDGHIHCDIDYTKTTPCYWIK